MVSWNSIIVGFAVNGHAEEALKFFDRMRADGFEPDGVSFTGALTACSHAGLVEGGVRISPRIEHYGCIVDLYSRAGRLEDAMRIIQTMPMKPNEVVLGSLMAACRTHGDVSLAERLMKYLTKLEPDCDSNYVLLSNTYAAVGKWNGAGKVREKMKALRIQKRPGCSSIEIDCCVHDFAAGDKSHAEADYIYEMLGYLSHQLRMFGYEPESIAGETGETSVQPSKVIQRKIKANDLKSLAESQKMKQQNKKCQSGLSNLRQNSASLHTPSRLSSLPHLPFHVFCTHPTMRPTKPHRAPRPYPR
ncbi:E motif [Dillenia turbinata]|uniref:E motif n=1 Tax=Dillenia turbinata TaxID=194707 RepID=A0AAN8Z8S2_9MAGN